MNILALNSSTLIGYFALFTNNDIDIGSFSDNTNPVSKIYDDIILPLDQEARSPANSIVEQALIIKNIPLTKIDDIQSLVSYNRTINANSQDRVIGLAIELYDTRYDANIETILAQTNPITISTAVYRFDLPSIDTYSLGSSSNNSISQIIDEFSSEKEIATINTFDPVVNITGGFCNSLNTNQLIVNESLSCNTSNTNQLIVNENLFFNTIVIRRPTFLTNGLANGEI